MHVAEQPSLQFISCYGIFFSLCSRINFFLALVEVYVYSFILLKTEAFDRAPCEYGLGNTILIENFETRIIHIVPEV